MSAIAKSLLGKVAVVTGASSGNGRAIALALANAGASVVCSDLQPKAREEGYETNLSTPTHEAITKAGGASIFQQCDASRDSDMRDLVKASANHFGRLDIMVNNAGIFTGLKDILEESVEEFDRTMAINTRGVYLGCKYAISQFMSQPEPNYSEGSARQEQPPIGKIINMASIGGLVGLAKEPAYCASKGAVVNLTRQLAIDFSPKRININAVCPGFLATAMVRPFIENPKVHQGLVDATCWPRLGTTQDVADATLFLASGQSDWMTGTTLTTDGGFTAK